MGKPATWMQRPNPCMTRLCSAEGSHVTCANPLYLCRFLNEWFLQETFFDKIDVEIQVSKSTYLFMVSCEIKYATYIANQHYKSLWRGGELPQSASLHSRVNISCESCDQEQEQSRPFQLIVNSKPLLFSRRKCCYTLSAYLTSSVQIEVAFQDKTKEAMSSLMFLCITSTVIMNTSL